MLLVALDDQTVARARLTPHGTAGSNPSLLATVPCSLGKAEAGATPSAESPEEVGQVEKVGRRTGAQPVRRKVGSTPSLEASLDFIKGGGRGWASSMAAFLNTDVKSEFRQNKRVSL